MRTNSGAHRDQNFALWCQDDGYGGMIEGVVESGHLVERSECPAGIRGWCEVQIDDLDDAPIAETVQQQRAAFQQNRRFLRFEKVSAKMDGGFLPGAARRTEANDKPGMRPS